MIKNCENARIIRLQVFFDERDRLVRESEAHPLVAFRWAMHSIARSVQVVGIGPGRTRNFLGDIFLDGADRVVSKNSIATEITEAQSVAGSGGSRLRTVNLRVAPARSPDGRAELSFQTLRGFAKIRISHFLLPFDREISQRYESARRKLKTEMTAAIALDRINEADLEKSKMACLRRVIYPSPT